MEESTDRAGSLVRHMSSLQPPDPFAMYGNTVSVGTGVRQCGGKVHKGKGTLLSQVEVAIVNAQVEKSSTIGLKTCCNKFVHVIIVPPCC